MKKKVLFSLLCLANLSLFGQQKGMANILKIELSYYTQPPSDSLKRTFTSSSSGFGVHYKGSLENSLSILLNKPLPLIKFNKKILEKYISFESQANNLEMAKALILEELKSHFYFQISDIKDSVDIWVLTRVNEKKLWIYTDDKPVRGIGASEENDEVCEICGMPMNDLIQTIEFYSKRLIVYTGESKILYNFDIPLKLLMNFDGLPEYLKENYGLELVKERRLVDKKYVEFD